MSPNPLAQRFALPLSTAAAGLGSPSHAATNTPVNPARMPSALPSLPVLSAFLFSHFPLLSPLAAAAEVPWLYHSPLPPRRQQKQTLPGEKPHQPPPRPLPTDSGVQKLILSITPTEGVYTALGASPLPPPLNHPVSDKITNAAPATAAVPKALTPPYNLDSKREKFTTAAFLHRPWTLARGRLPHGTTVWTSHKAFDEGLTTGYNLALLERLGANVDETRARVLVGYKGDEGRRIGVVAGFGETGREELEIDVVKDRIVKEFGDLEGEGAWFGFLDGKPQKVGGDDGMATDHGDLEPGKITSIACMNAFHPAEVERVAAAAVEAGIATSLENCSGLLYLTGAANEEGVEAALAKRMKVVCVGHRLCEVWGIVSLADRVRERWPGVEVQVVDEEEVKPPPKEKVKISVKPPRPQKNKIKGRPKQKQQNDVLEAETPVAKKKRTNSEDKEEEGGVML